MFTSTHNNFGADEIEFLSVFEDNCLILNATVPYRTDSADYLAADTLEISVPALPLERSAESAVVLRFTDRTDSTVSDGGTVLKSWIRDRNTLCIEKLTAFDAAHTEMTIYIQSLYLRLNSGANATVGTKTKITAKPSTKYITWGSYHFCVVHPKWVFLHIHFSSAYSTIRSSDWRCIFDGLPLDVKADIPIMMSSCPNTASAGGVNLCHVEDGVWTLPASERNEGFTSSGNAPFSFACLIRDIEDVPDVSNRLRIAESPIKGSGYVQMADFELEVEPTPAFSYVAGSTGQYSTAYCEVYPEATPEGMPSFKTYLLATATNGSKLCIDLCSMTINTAAAKPTIRFENQTGGTKFIVKLSDTGAAIALNS